MPRVSSRVSIPWQKLAKELLWFLLTVIGSFLFWCVLALIVEQNIIVEESLYKKELNAFMITIAFIYFLRLNAWVIKQGGKKHEITELKETIFIKEKLDGLAPKGRQSKNESVEAHLSEREINHGPKPTVS